MTYSLLSPEIVLFIPNSRWYDKRPWMQLPYTISILTALLKEEFGLKLFDANAENLTEEECLFRLKENKPDMLLVSGISVEYFQQYHKTFEIAKTVNQDCITVFGGVYPTLMPEEALKDKNIDYVFIGHAEERISDFINIVLTHNKDTLKDLHGIGFRDENGKTIIKPIKSFISDINEVVKPDYSLIDVNAYISYKSQDVLDNTTDTGTNVTIVTSFGCPYNCSFCATRTINGRSVNFRPIEDILYEIEFFIKEYGVTNITFIDENLTFHRKRVEEILNAFIDRKYNIKWQMANVAIWHLDDKLLVLMHKSGCTAISPSIESGSRRVLRDLVRKPLKILEKAPGIVKKCKELGINVMAHFVIGLPGETWEEIRQTFRFAESLDCDLVVFHIATPYPKTELYDIAVKNKLLPEDFSFYSPEFYGTSSGFITTDQFTPHELMVLRSFEWDRINFSTPEKTEKIAKMMSMTIEELNNHRKQTRLKAGVHY